MNIKEIVEQVLRNKNCAMHVDQIAETAIKMELCPHNDNLSKKISACLSSDIKKYNNNSLFRKVENNHGGKRRGYYKLKRFKRTAKDNLISNLSNIKDYLKPEVNSCFIGKGGEFAVLSELLFNGYNASIMTVDDGIDIVASKFGKFFFIQVKTSYIKNAKIQLPAIKLTRFSKYDKDNTFYVFVLRFYSENTPRNDFLIFRSTDIEKFIEQGKIRKNDNLGVKLQFEKDKIIIYNGSANEEVNYHFNNFALIK